MGTGNPHGTVDIEWHDNVLVLRCHGPYNSEGIGQSIALTKADVAEKAFEHWYRIDILDDETLGSPEVVQLIGEFYVWCMHNQCTEAVIVCSNVIQEQLVQQFIDRTGARMVTAKLYNEAINYINLKSAGDKSAS